MLINEFDYQHFEGQGVKVTHGTAMRYLANLQIGVKPQNEKRQHNFCGMKMGIAN